MSPGLSAYLDLLRLLSALVVFAHHASYDRFGGGWILPLRGYGHEAVMSFFVLSGFVVTWTVEVKDRTLRSYALSRLTRLWSVALPALVLTTIIDLAGRAMYPPLYENLDVMTAGAFALNAALVNEFWFLSVTPGSNIPYWSLSYEFAYYFLFALFVFFPGRIILWALGALLVGPKILLLLPAWAAGSIAYRLSRRPIGRRLAAMLAIGGGLFALGVSISKLGNTYITWRLEQIVGPENFKPFEHAQGFISDNLIALGIAAHFVGMACLLRHVRPPRWLSIGMQRAALATFPIYLMHYSCLQFFTALSIAFSGHVYGLAVGLSSLAVGVIATPCAERLKRALRASLEQFRPA